MTPSTYLAAFFFVASVYSLFLVYVAWRVQFDRERFAELPDDPAICLCSATICPVFTTPSLSESVNTDG